MRPQATHYETHERFAWLRLLRKLSSFEPPPDHAGRCNACAAQRTRYETQKPSAVGGYTRIQANNW
jgi:hypothetical protein